MVSRRGGEGQMTFPSSSLPVEVLPSDDLTLELEGQKLHAVPRGAFGYG